MLTKLETSTVSGKESAAMTAMTYLALYMSLNRKYSQYYLDNEYVRN